LIDGGVLCNQCRVGKQQVAAVSAGVLRTLAQFADPDRQAWHDRIAGTFVVKVPRAWPI
jgi:uncharacterized RDD family membrane protein YckC